MTRVRIVCDSNFKKTEDVDRSIAKVLKMFSEHFVKKMAPLNEESDMECVYVYDDLTSEQVRLLKRLLNHNKSLLNFKEMIISKPGGADGADGEDGEDGADGDDSGSSTRSDSSTRSQSLHSLRSASATSSPRSPRSTRSSEDSFRSQSKPRSSFRGTKSAESLVESRYSKVAEMLRELADEVEKLSA